MRRPTTLRCAALVACGGVISFAATARADTIDHGPAHQATRCSELDNVDSSCVLAFGEPATVPVAITSVALGAVDPSDLRVATPSGDRWITRPAVSDVARWQVRSDAGTSAMIADTALGLGAGEQLVVVDPMVRAGAVTDFDVPEDGPFDGSALVAGQVVPIEVAGSITTEPDADGDGYGDISADVCPGVKGAICDPGRPEITLTSPGYVPALDPVVVPWSVRNRASTPQPFVLNWSSRTRVDQFIGPPGMTCAPGRTATPIDLFVSSAGRSPLLTLLLRPGASVRATTAWLPGTPAEVSTTCRLPVIGPGGSVSGTIGGTGWSTDKREGDGVALEVIAPTSDAGGPAFAAGYARSSMRIFHPDDARPRALLAPKSVRAAGPAGRPGRLPVSLTVLAPRSGVSPSITGELRAVQGGRVLARIIKPIGVTPAKPATVRFSFSRSGMRWLAAHRRTTKLLAVMTASNDRELPSTSRTRITLKRSPSLRRQLAKLTQRR